MSKAVLDDPETKKARVVLLRAYRRMRRPSWQRVADRYELANKGRAYQIAHGNLKVNPVTDAALVRAVRRESDASRAPIKTRRLIKKIAVPFLDSRQRSRRRVYGAGGRPL